VQDEERRTDPRGCSGDSDVAVRRAVFASWYYRRVMVLLPLLLPSP
jgi:hypothetical protein